MLLFALLASAVGGCHLIFTYEDRDTLDSAAPREELGVDKDGPGKLDRAPPDAPVQDRTLDTRAQDIGNLDSKVLDKGKPDSFKVLDKGKPDSFKIKDLGCPPGTKLCGGKCVDLAVDKSHCGKCNNACPSATTDRCLVGICSCGGVGAACVGGLNCSAAKCACVPGGLCSGCCDGNTCRALGAGQSLTKCGKGGAVCNSCDDGNDCTADACSAQGACTKSNKSTGASCKGGKGQCAGGTCCQGCRQGSVCKGGASTSSCGVGGEVCKSCPGVTCQSPSCTSSGSCVKISANNGTSCNAGKGQCAGGTCCEDCRQGNTCNLGTSHYICGKGGIVCENCTLNSTLKLCTNQVCSAGVTCGSVNCSGGCCAGNTCMLFGQQSDAVCGKNGLPCSSCIGGKFCKNGSCVP